MNFPYFSSIIVILIKWSELNFVELLYCIFNNKLNNLFKSFISANNINGIKLIVVYLRKKHYFKWKIVKQLHWSFNNELKNFYNKLISVITISKYTNFHPDTCSNFAKQYIRSTILYYPPNRFSCKNIF